jgi:hypothetical protein
VDVDANQIVVRGGKGDRDRVTMLPAIVKADLVVAASRPSAPSTRTISRPARLGRAADGAGAEVPDEGPEWAWQWVFPAHASTVTCSPSRLALVS